MTHRLCDYYDCANAVTIRAPSDGDVHRMRFCQDHWQVFDALAFNATDGFDDHEDIARLEKFWKSARGMIA